MADHVVPTMAPLSPRARAPVGRVVAPEILLEWPGLMEAEDPAMRERLVALKLQRDQIAREIGSARIEWRLRRLRSPPKGRSDQRPATRQALRGTSGV